MIELTLPTMTCGHCVKAVTAAVQQVDAAAKLQIDLPTHRVRIESDAAGGRVRARAGRRRLRVGLSARPQSK